MFRLRLQRYWYRRRHRLNVAWREFLSTPLPAGKRRLVDCSLLCLDLETTSLEADAGEIASIGWVAIERGAVVLASAEHYRVRLRGEVGQSAIYHEMTDEMVASGVEEAWMVERLCQVAAGRVVVFHHAALDMAFLNALCLRLAGVPFLVPVIDTMELERRSLSRTGLPPKRQSLRLFSCRERYNLPLYPAHDALSDALATAELLLAQVAFRGGLESPLRRYLAFR